MIFILDDDGFHVDIVKKAFPNKKIQHFTDSVSLLEAVKKSKNVELVVIDLYLDYGNAPEKFIGNNPKIEGILVADKLRKYRKKLPIVLSTRYADQEIFWRAKYLNIIPVEIPEEATVGVQKLRELFPELAENGARMKELFRKFGEAGFITSSQRMIEVLELADKWKDLDEPILITGETGTGKDTLAKAIHLLSWRKDEPFINFVISAYPRENLHSKLFGVKGGAFTGVKESPGVLESVKSGTLVLNEIGDLMIEAQIELLQVIDERIYFKMADHTPKQFKGRFILLTNKDVKKLVQEGKFRKDLYRRIEGFQLEIPPLRERKEDIPLLLQHFAPELVFTNSATDYLLNEFPFPENVGTLRNLVKYLRTTLTDRNIVTLDDILEAVNKINIRKGAQLDDKDLESKLPDIVLDFILQKGITLKEFQDLVIERAYEKFGRTWKKNTWGKIGIPRTTFYRHRS